METLKQIQLHRTTLEKTFSKLKTVKQINDHTQALVYLYMLEEMIKKDNVKNLSFPLLVKAYDEYIAIVTKENQLMGPIALNNGFVPDQSEIVKAEQLRNRIVKIKAQI